MYLSHVCQNTFLTENFTSRFNYVIFSPENLRTFDTYSWYYASKCYLATTKENRLESQESFRAEIWKILVNKVSQYIMKDEKLVGENV